MAEASICSSLPLCPSDVIRLSNHARGLSYLKNTRIRSNKPMRGERSTSLPLGDGTQQLLRRQLAEWVERTTDERSDPRARLALFGHSERPLEAKRNTNMICGYCETVAKSEVRVLGQLWSLYWAMCSINGDRITKRHLQRRSDQIYVRIGTLRDRSDLTC
ncbi:hypothetical protein RRG08_013595 [Elysia crispata]|uniref:Uncharacterized protein n=1 Tax=Elysia crispata TaxID=231223 RepID=A0AAE0Y350_9GAST|nr:hypothetical protein RRG08_013595 [Elysia crispata]